MSTMREVLKVTVPAARNTTREQVRREKIRYASDRRAKDEQRRLRRALNDAAFFWFARKNREACELRNPNFDYDAITEVLAARWVMMRPPEKIPYEQAARGGGRGSRGSGEGRGSNGSRYRQ